MNIFENIERSSLENSMNIALFDDKLLMSYQQLYGCLVNNQAILKAQGYCSGDKVIIMVENQFDFVIAFLSFLSIECWVIPIPRDITIIELQRIIDFTGAKGYDKKILKLVVEYK